MYIFILFVLTEFLNFIKSYYGNDGLLNTTVDIYGNENNSHNKYTFK